MRHPASSSPRSLANARGGAATWLLILIVLAAAGFAVYWFVLRNAGPGGATAALVSRVMPADIQSIGGIDPAALATDPTLRDLVRQNSGADVSAFEAKLKEAGVTLSDIKAIALGLRMDGSVPKAALFAVETTADTQALAAFAGSLASQLPPDLKVAMPNFKVEAVKGGIVLAGEGALVAEALAVTQGNAKSFDASGPMKDVRAALPSNASLWFAAPLPAEATGQLPGMVSGMLGGTPSHVAFAYAPGTPGTATVAVLIPGSKASDVASSLQGLVSLFSKTMSESEREVAKLIKLSGSNSTVLATLALDNKLLGTLVR